MAHGPNLSEHFEQYTLKNIFSLPLGDFTTKNIAELTKNISGPKIEGQHDPPVRYPCCSIRQSGYLGPCTLTTSFDRYGPELADIFYD